MDNAENLGELLCEMAEEIFIECGAADDFCIQSVGSAAAVFGGTNRLIFTIKGFHIDESYCNHEFRRLFYKLKGEGKV